MNHRIIKYNETSYVCRLIPDYDEPDTGGEFNDLLVAPIELEQVLDRSLSIAAKHLDELICYYATSEEMRLSDRELYEIIYH
jgi:hypothetical protein